MNDDGAPGWLRAVVAFAGSCAAVALLGAIVFALWSLVGGTTIPGAVDDGATRIALWSALGAAVVLVPLTAAVRTGRWAAVLVCGLFTGIVMLAVTAVYDGWLPGAYTFATTNYVISQALPASMVAWALALFGCVLATLAAFPLVSHPAARGHAAAGMAAGVVAVVVTASVYLPDADPDRHIDASTAAETTVADIPATFTGAEQFTLPFDVSGSAGTVIQDVVLAAGAGFVVRGASGVVAYDPKGLQRWHFEHTGGWVVTDFRVFDDGATVMLLYTSEARGAYEAIALDANTGRVLWRSAAPEVVETLLDYTGQLDDSTRPLYLTVRRATTLARIDTRTGDTLWTVDVPENYEVLETNTGVGYFIGYDVDGVVELHYVSLDPGDGALRFDVVVSTYPVSALDPDSFYSETEVFDVTHAGRYGAAMHDGLGRWFYVDTRSGAVIGLDEPVWFGSPFGDGFVTSTLGGRDVLHGPDGSVLCEVGTSDLTASTYWLSEQVIRVFDGAMRVLNSSDCTLVADHDIYGDDVVVAPGVVLVVDPAEAGTITGYT